MVVDGLMDPSQLSFLSQPTQLRVGRTCSRRRPPWGVVLEETSTPPSGAAHALQLGQPLEAEVQRRLVTAAGSRTTTPAILQSQLRPGRCGTPLAGERRAVGLTGGKADTLPDLGRLDPAG